MKRIFNFFFTPTEENYHRAKLLHSDALSFYLLFAIFLVFIIKLTPLSNILGYATDVTSQKLYQLTNEKRIQNNLPQLVYSEKLSKAAEQKAMDMFNKNYWSHFSPTGESPWRFLESQDYKYEFAGENLAKNFLFSDNVVDAWMASTTHKENILRKEFTEVGFARVDGLLDGQQTTLVVQFFGKPATTNLLTLGETTTAPSPQKVVSKTRKAIDLSKISFNFTVFLILFISIALISDLYIASKLRLIRIHGRNIAHLIFLFTMLTGLFFFLSKGVIL